jgi:hypothetical protein
VFWEYRGMGNDETLDLIAAQERALEKFAEASPQETLALVEGLTATMRTVVEDEALWNRLAEASVRAEGAGQIRQLVLVDWETLLEQCGVPEAQAVALELIEAVTHADEPGGWEQARAHLLELTELLEGDAQQPRLEEPGWLARVRERAAVGYSALRRVRKGVIVAESGFGMAEAVTPMLVGVALGAPLGPVGAVVGAAVGGLGLGLAKGLREALRRSSEEVPGELDALFRAPALDPAANGAARANLDLIVALSEGERWDSAITDLLADLRLWAARIGATLSVAWPLVGAHLGKVGLRAIEQVMVALFDFQRSLRRIAQAGSDEDCNLLREGVDWARETTEKIADSLWRLEGLVDHR